MSLNRFGYKPIYNNLRLFVTFKSFVHNDLWLKLQSYTKMERNIYIHGEEERRERKYKGRAFRVYI